MKPETRAKKAELAKLERESEVATIALFTINGELARAKEATRKAQEEQAQVQENYEMALTNFKFRKLAFLQVKRGDATLAEFVAQGFHFSIKPAPEPEAKQEEPKP